MKNQQDVVITGFRAKNYKTIQAVNFTYDLMKNKIINITGEIGSSKTSILECMEIALTGVSGISKKDTIKDGFVTELQLTDGDIKLWLGVHSREKTRGDKAGEHVIETFIYTKNDDGTVNKQPIVDGKVMTAKDYIKILNSDLSFNLKDLFSKNATTHRKFIEKIYNTELKGLGVDEVVDRINEAKKTQDKYRALCDASGAFMSTFKAEGYDEEYLAGLSRFDIEKIRDLIISKEIEKDRILNSSNEAKELNKLTAQNERNSELELIKTKANKVIESIRDMNREKEQEYLADKEKYQIFSDAVKKHDEYRDELKTIISDSDFFTDDNKKTLYGIIEKQYSDNIGLIGIMPKLPVEPKIIPIISGVIDMPEDYDKEYEPHIKLRNKYLKEYASIKNKELNIEDVKAPDVTVIDKEIEALKTKLVRAEGSNGVLDRYIQWCDWIEAKGIYQKEIDTLRKLYAKVDTGVNGLSIVPKEKGGRIEIWLQYNGCYDADFFSNTESELRYITEYSESQRGVIAILLQAARLDKKQKALRLALIDSTPFYTKVGMAMLNKIQKDKNVRLITTHTSDIYDKDNLDDGMVVMEGGEAFFRGVK